MLFPNNLQISNSPILLLEYFPCIKGNKDYSSAIRQAVRLIKVPRYVTGVLFPDNISDPVQDIMRNVWVGSNIFPA